MMEGEEEVSATSVLHGDEIRVDVDYNIYMRILESRRDSCAYR